MNWSLKVRSLLRRERTERELDDELRFHFEQQVAESMAAGLSRSDAERAAHRTIGGLTQISEECREARGTGWLEDLGKDLRYGVRAMLHSPVFAIVAVLSLALGIGINTAIFSVVNGVLLRPLPFRDPDRLAMVWDTYAARNKTHNVISPADYLEWQSGTSAFEQMAAIDYALSNLTGVADPQEIRGQFVSPSFFGMLGVGPVLGRSFSEEETRSRAKVLVVSHRFWERRLAASPSAVGATVELDRQPYTVIGVMPAEFEFLDTGSDYWRPFYVDPQRDYRKRDGRFMRALVRLRSGVTRSQAQAQLSAVAARLEQQYPFHKGWGVRLVDLREEESGDFRRPLYVLLGAVCLVLLIACGNVANLLLSRASARRKEMAIRTSMGAGPWRIARQLLAESLLLGVLGGGIGLLLAYWGVQALRSGAPVALPRLDTLGVDGRALAFTSLISLFSALLFGMAPAILGARVRPGDALKDSARTGGSTRRSRRLPDLLVMFEFALSLVLLAGSGLLIRSFANLYAVDTGFRADHLLIARILLPGTYKTPETLSFFREATQRLETLPGVQSASAVSFMPFGGIRPGTGFRMEDGPQPAETPVIEVRSIRPKYFRTMGIPLLRGRDIADRDADPAHPVFVINESMARKYWPGQSPLGQHITVDMTSHPMPGEIVGVAADVKDQKLDGSATPSVFYAHPGLPIGYMSLVVRTAGDPSAMGQALVRVVHSIDGNQPVADLLTMDQMLARSVASRRFQMLLLGLFAGLALVLAAVGIYGVIAYAVLQRNNEIGIRIALGAGRGDVMRLVLGQGSRIVLGGLVLGTTAALALTRAISVFLFGVKATDPLTFVAVSLVLVLVALGAMAVPVRRATQVDPLAALRM